MPSKQPAADLPVSDLRHPSRSSAELVPTSLARNSCSQRVPIRIFQFRLLGFGTKVEVRHNPQVGQIDLVPDSGAEAPGNLKSSSSADHLIRQHYPEEDRPFAGPIL